MAIWGVRPFENEFALDIVPSIARGDIKHLPRRMGKIFDEVLSDDSPLVTGVPTRELVDPRNVDALVQQFGVLEKVKSMLGAIEESGKLWITSSNAAECQQAFALSALIAIARTPGTDAGIFGDPPTSFRKVIDALVGLDLRIPSQRATEVCRHLQRDGVVRREWFGAEEWEGAQQELDAQISHMVGILSQP